MTRQGVTERRVDLTVRYRDRDVRMQPKKARSSEARVRELEPHQRMVAMPWSQSNPKTVASSIGTQRLALLPGIQIRQESRGDVRRGGPYHRARVLLESR